MSKGIKILRYIITIAASLLFVIYILKIAGVGLFSPLKDCILLFPFWVLVAINMILVIRAQLKAKNSVDK